MGDNPFDKSAFKVHRDWEESLVSFFVDEAKSPNVDRWLAMATACDDANRVGYSALLLSNLVENKPGFRESAETLYGVYEQLKGVDCGAKEYEGWLRTGWLNVSRVADMLNVKLSQLCRKQ